MDLKLIVRKGDLVAYLDHIHFDDSKGAFREFRESYLASGAAPEGLNKAYITHCQEDNLSIEQQMAEIEQVIELVDVLPPDSDSPEGDSLYGYGDATYIESSDGPDHDRILVLRDRITEFRARLRREIEERASGRAAINQRVLQTISEWEALGFAVEFVIE